MEKKIKHRILGIIVIISLIILALPLFRGNKVNALDNLLKETPPFPDQTVQVISPESTAAISEPVLTANIRNDAVLASVPRIANQIQKSAWMLQVGSFKNKVNAIQLANKLRSNGYEAFITSTHQSMVRVIIGPGFSRSDVTALSDKISKEMHLQTTIINSKTITL